MSHYEYGEMLYANPRGVSCTKCHGKKGEGKVIVTYRYEKREYNITSPNIRETGFQEMLGALGKSHRIMPRYYLTDEEVKAIYDYLHSNKE